MHLEAINRELQILKDMIGHLPMNVAIHFMSQLGRLCETLNAYHSQVAADLAQLELDIHYLRFDCEATKRERDVLQQQLGRPSN